VTRTAKGALPAYAAELAAFHRAFAPELKSIVDSLPLSPRMHVLDIGCGDGFYLELLAKRITTPGRVVGLDICPAYLEVARQRFASREGDCEIDFICGNLDDLPRRGMEYDFAWCAQGLFSLPEPVNALREMAAIVRPGGGVAVLENDTLHQLLLPWPDHLELALRTAEFRALSDQSTHAGKYYVGRRLPAVFAAAGLEPLGFMTQCIDRQAPLDESLERFLQAYLARLARRVDPYIDRSIAYEFSRILDPHNDAYLLRQPYLTLSWLNMLAWGKRPITSGLKAGNNLGDSR
jgi:ubiquinone/menaquinone biosynthesis C-methylase UbiE